MQSVALVFHVALCIGVIALVLLQHGKGADAGAAFGSGASGTVFGARGAATFMTRMTTLLVSLFFITSITLFYLAAHRDRGVTSVTDLPSERTELPETVPEESTATTEIPPGADSPDLPAVDLPAADAPVSDLPAADVPDTDLPDTDLPDTDPPADAAPAVGPDSAPDPELPAPAQAGAIEASPGGEAGGETEPE